MGVNDIAAIVDTVMVMLTIQQKIKQRTCKSLLIKLRA